MNQATSKLSNGCNGDSPCALLNRNSYAVHVGAVRQSKRGAIRPGPSAAPSATNVDVINTRAKPLSAADALKMLASRMSVQGL